ncbi:MAG: hypothetical protein B7Z55_19610 [Planctomycetales bacterium 12-60-4]|nr:MAG: hypothetical protein B7Z55_19610 [Planctomycetales bacterium 12-60-4]
MHAAIRDGDWKLLARLDLPKFPPGADVTAEQMQALKSAEPVAYELYNLREDSAESHDRQAAEPERFHRMCGQLLAMYHEVREESPVWPAWTWPRYEAQRIEWPSYRRKP